MLTEKNLSLFKRRILSEAINIPNHTKNAKVVTHVDLDGVISGITMLKQLEKQGISPNRVTIELAQYGDDEKEGDKKYFEKFSGKKGQFVGVTDFSKLPKAKPFKIFNGLMSFKGNEHKKEFVDFLNSNNFENMSKENFKKALTSKFSINENKFTDKSINDLYIAAKTYSKILNEKNKILNFNKDKEDKEDRLPEGLKKFEKATVENIENFSLQTIMPQFVADHHSNENNSLSSGKTGKIEAESPSEAEDLAKEYAPGLWPKEDIKAVSMVDSAGYDIKNLENTVFLEKNFKGPNKKKNLAILISCLYDNLAKKDREAAKWVIKNSGTNLVSVYNTTLKAIKYNNERLEYLSMLKNGDVEGAKKILKDIPKPLTQQYDRKDAPIKKAMNHEEWQAKNLKDLANARTGYKTEKDEQKLQDIKGKRGDENKEIRDYVKSKKGKVEQYHNFTFFNGKDKKTQYSRFIPSLYSVNGKRTPFALRYWDGMFQLSKNTLYKGHVNFQKVQEYVFKDIENELKKNGINEIKIKNIIEEMKEKNGGHSTGIWSFSGFNNIKPSSKEYEDYWDKRSIVSRAEKIKKDPKTLVPNAYKRKEEIESGAISKYKKIRESVFKKAISSAVYWTNELFPVKEEDTKDLYSNNEKFEGKPPRKW